MQRRTPIAVILTVLMAAVAAVPAAAAPTAHRAGAEIPPVYDPGPPPGAQVLEYRQGPYEIKPGQNFIDLDIQRQRPAVNGWIVGFRPGLVDAKTGRSPSVDVVHLHHAVWLMADRSRKIKPIFATGEEKTYFAPPRGYGWRYETNQLWVVNHMIHDLVGSPHSVYITYTLWFIPDSAPEAAGMKRIDTQWMDVQGIKPYPVFDAPRGAGGGDGRFTYPDEARNPYPDGFRRNQWVADRDATLVWTGGHVHPGGLWTDLDLTRDGRTVRLFRSDAVYFEPTGPVSWDAAMTVSRPDWRVAIRKGDVLSLSTTYDTTRASWYEAMGINVVAITEGPDGGVDPFTTPPDTTGVLSHGRLPENIEPETVGAPNPGLANPIRLRGGPLVDRVVIRNFAFGQGDLSRRGRAGLPPSVPQGRQLTFVNQDNPLAFRFHTITACKAPCNATGGIRYPLADAPTIFDSGQLGYGPVMNTSGIFRGGAQATPITAVTGPVVRRARCARTGGVLDLVGTGCIGRTQWKTPRNLTPGTYTYFCRIHPFMRGAFRVTPKRG